MNKHINEIYENTNKKWSEIKKKNCSRNESRNGINKRELKENWK